MAIAILVKEGTVSKEIPLEISVPEKLNICWKHIGGYRSVTAEQREALVELFKSPEDVILKVRAAFGLDLPTPKKKRVRKKQTEETVSEAE